MTNQNAVKLTVGAVVASEETFTAKTQGRQNEALTALVATIVSGINAKDKQTKGCSIMIEVDGLKPHHVQSIKAKLNKDVNEAFDIARGVTGKGKQALRILRNCDQSAIDAAVKKALGVAGKTGN